MLSYYIMHDVVNSLDDKFKEQFNSFDRIFFSSNYIKMLDYYNILSFKGNPFNLRSKIENEKQREVLKFLIKEIKENNYDQSLILLAYGFVINNSINDICKPYFSSLCGIKTNLHTIKNKQKLQRIISYHLRDLFPDKNKDYKKTPSTYKATKLELDTIIKLYTNIYSFSNTKKIINKCEDNLYFYYNQNINFLFFKKCYYSFLDKHSNSKVAIRPSLRTGLFKSNIDYLNIQNKEWLNPYTNEINTSSFLDIYKQILADVNPRINKLNNMIFYNERGSINVIKRKEFIVANHKLTNPIFHKLTKFKK